MSVVVVVFVLVILVNVLAFQPSLSSRRVKMAPKVSMGIPREISEIGNDFILVDNTASNELCIGSDKGRNTATGTTAWEQTV